MRGGAKCKNSNDHRDEKNINGRYTVQLNKKF